MVCGPLIVRVISSSSSTSVTVAPAGIAPATSNAISALRSALPLFPPELPVNRKSPAPLDRSPSSKIVVSRTGESSIVVWAGTGTDVSSATAAMAGKVARIMGHPPWDRD